MTPQAIIGLAIAVFLAVGSFYGGVRYMEPKVLEAAAKATQNEKQLCLKSQSITEESQNALQSDLNNLRAEYSRMRKQAGVSLHPASTPGSHDGTACDNGFSLSLRYIASKEAKQLKACQDFIGAERN